MPLFTVPVRRVVPAALLWLACAVAAAADTRAPAPDNVPAADAMPTAEARTEQLLRALGGRARWAALTSLVNDSEQHRSEPPHSVRARIHMDLKQARWRIETTAADLHTIRVWDGPRAQGWRLTREGSVEDLPAALREEDLRWHRGHVYRTLHRLASREAALQARLRDDGRLEVLEDGVRIAWFQLSGNGEPYAFGAHDDDIGSRSGPWSHVQDGIRHPIWVANASGTWRANLVTLATNVALDDALFQRPAHLWQLASLHGRWQGDGVFQGQSAQLVLDIAPVLAAAHTRWSVQVGIGGQTVFSGLLHQRRDADGLHGEWRDSSGAVYPVRTEFRADCLIADWQRGHSRYCLSAANRMTVEDHSGTLSADTASTPFARYTLQRED